MRSSALGNVCKDCADRHVGCHAECDRYLSAKAKHEDERAMIRDKRSKDLYYLDLTKNKKRTEKIRMKCYRNYGV